MLVGTIILSALCPAAAAASCAEAVPMRRQVSSESQDSLHRENLCEGAMGWMAAHIGLSNGLRPMYYLYSVSNVKH